ncbi:MAG TPA: hypothetical protein VGB61_04490, partial [Pyrinomonadaceae bacterium]
EEFAALPRSLLRIQEGKWLAICILRSGLMCQEPSNNSFNRSANSAACNENAQADYDSCSWRSHLT